MLLNQILFTVPCTNMNKVKKWYGNRGIIGGGVTGSTAYNTMDYITISTLGNALDFGDLTVARTGSAACSGD